MFPAVLEFMWVNFMPDEPCNRSLGTTRNWVVDDFYFGEALKDGCSMAALDKDGNIVGARIGMRKMKSEWMSWFLDRLPFHTPTWLLKLMPLPENSLKILPVFIKLFTLNGYDVWKMFDQLGCDLIYEDKALCTGRALRVRGLGTELCRRTERLARDLGCTHTYACVSGILLQI